MGFYRGNSENGITVTGNYGEELRNYGDSGITVGITVTGATTPNSEGCIDLLSNPIGNSRPPAKIQRVEAGADGFDDGVKHSGGS